MLKNDLFFKILNSDTCLLTEWVTKYFSLFREKSDQWKSDPYLYRLVAQIDGWFFVNEEGVLEKIEDAPVGVPVFKKDDPLFVKAGSIGNAIEDIPETTYGTALTNNILLARWFDKRIPYMVGKIPPSRLSNAVLELLVDDPEDGGVVEAGMITVSEYLQFADAVFNLVGYTQVVTPAATEKSMTAPPDAVMFRNILIEENRGRLHDPAVIANIAKQLQEYDYEYLRGDPSLGFMLKDKSLKLVRTKLFLMYGAERGLEDTIEVNLIERSLSEGWDIDKFPEMNNAQRAGSYNRGKETERGGAKVKEIYRAAGNMRIAIDNCGSTLGVPYLATSEMKKQIIGFTSINLDGSQTKITKENVQEFVNRPLRLRSTMYCRGEKTDYCAVCSGDRMSTNREGLPLELTAYGSRFLDMYMAAAHAKAITTRKLNFKKLIS